MKLCNAPTPEYNWFDIYMLTSQRVMMIQKKIVDHHGRIENVKLFNCDPTHFLREAKQKEEDHIKAEKEIEKKNQLARDNGEEVEESKEEGATKAAAQVADDEPTEPEYVSYDNPSMTIFEIFDDYGKETKAEVDEEPLCQKKLFYDFTPFNSKDPVLLSLMTAKKYP